MTASAATTPFAYPVDAPLGFVDRGRVNDKYPIAVRDVSFFSQGRRVDGYLAVPPRKGPLPAAIVLHGQGGDRTSMLVQATWLAARGVVVMTLTAPSTTATRPAGLSATKTLAFERDLAVRDVVAVRRAVDALARHRLVDERRIGFVGWSLGARSGAVVAGVEPRIDGLALLSAGATPVATYAAAAPASLRPVDPPYARGHRPAPVGGAIPTRERAAARRTQGRGGAASRAARAAAIGAEGHRRPLVPGRSRAERDGVDGSAGLAGREAPARSAPGSRARRPGP